MNVLVRFATWTALLCAAGAAFAASSELETQQKEGAEDSETATLSQAELDQLAAPIALYPDSLIPQILMASTYPLEVVEAARWQKANPKLKGDALAKELEKKSWDPSVRSLVAFPDVLQTMDEKLDWTQRLGNAVLVQEKDLMEAIQRLRRKAIDAGQLKTSPEQEVEVDEQIVVIQSTNTEVVYVPTYNPVVVYGSWPYPAYPPYCYHPPHYYNAAYAFTAGVAVGVAWGYAWGDCF